MDTQKNALQKWITTVIVMTIVYWVFMGLGSSLLPRLCITTGMDFGTLFGIYFDLSVVIFAVLMWGWIKCGSLVKERAPWAHGLLLGYGYLCIAWQIISLVAYHAQMGIISTPLQLGVNICSAIPICAAMIILGCKYQQRDLIGLGIGYTVFHSFGLILYPLANALASSGHVIPTAIFGLTSLVSVILQIVYLFHWRKVANE